MPAREGDIENSFSDISSISRDLGYSPAVTLEEGLSRYLKWFVHRE
jgi:UDP-glucuronate 4-epimerase